MENKLTCPIQKLDMIISYAKGLLLGNKLSKFIKLHHNFPFDYKDIRIMFLDLLVECVSLTIINFRAKNVNLIPPDYHSLKSQLARGDIDIKVVKFCT